MTNGGGKHPRKKAVAKNGGKAGKKTAAELARAKLTKNLQRPEKPTS